MNCTNCGRANRTGARFCSGCGKPLAPRCPACGSESEPDAQFCDACGTALVARPAEEAVARKVVSIVFADLIGSTSLHERLDAESARRLMDRYYRTLHTVIEAHGGTVVKLLGDGVMAAFGVPRVAEDDAIRAVRAAVAMVQGVRGLGVAGLRTLTPNPLTPNPLSVRVAVNTGEVVVNADQHDVVGDPVNVAARLQQEARDGDVLIGESTRRLVNELVTLAPLGALSLKGRSETVAAYRVVSLERPAGAMAIPFVGREDELRRMTAVYHDAVAARRAHLVVILGSPGLGKSRLTTEFARRLGVGTTVLTARCDAAAGATFAPLAEALRNVLHLNDATGGEALCAAIEAAMPAEETERSRIAAGVGALLTGTPATSEETFFVVRRFLAALAAVRPVVLVIDDLHWAEPLLLDLTEHLVQWGTGVPLLVLAAARPELRDVRASLAVAGDLVRDVVTLTGLDAGAATRLAANVVGASELPAAVAGRVLATSEGNPLFLGELVRMLVEDGVLRREGDRWVAAADLAGIEVPPTIQALLAARIERLRSEERTVLERAAVIGRQFSRAAVAHLLPPELHADLDARLESLRRSDLIEPDTGWFLEEPVLRFHHALIRDAAYRRLLKGTRAELHGRFAAWIEARIGQTGEHDETTGWHLEQAHQNLRELGPLDETGRTFGERAARYLAAAGRRALARDDLAPAASLLGRALDRLDSADPARADLALDWCEALLAAGDVGPAVRAVDELGRWIDPATPIAEADGVGGAPFETVPDDGGISGRVAGSASREDVSAGAEEGALSRRPSRSPDRLRAWRTCFVGQLAVLTDPQALRATVDVVAGAAETLAAASDPAGEAKAHSVHALALARLGKIGACEAALDRALAAARRGGDRRRANAVLAGAPVAALWGPSPVTRASGRCLDVVRVLRITQGAPAVEAVALRCQAVLEALRGRTDAARRMITSSRHMVEELGITQRVLEADMFAGLIELLDGDAAAAERCLRGAYDGLRSHGLGIDAAQAAALLGRALLAQGRGAEAEALSHESEALAGDDMKAAIAWRGVRAEALARRGEHATAVELARAGVAVAAATDALLDHADARLALATALRAAGRHAEAGGEEAYAIELWETKGATLLVERARHVLGSVTHPEPSPDRRITLPYSPHRRVRTNAATANAARGADAELPPNASVSPFGNGREREGVRPGRDVGLRVLPNAATAAAARMPIIVAARDADTLERAFTHLAEVVDHPTGAVLDRRGMLAAWRSLLRAQDPVLRTEPLATLGDALALCRSSMSFGALAEDDVAPFGAVRRDEIVLVEVNRDGQQQRNELFDPSHLGDAVTRLYERYAELLPERAEKLRAAATARSVAVLMEPPNLDHLRMVFAPDVEFADHRTLGFAPMRGAQAMLRAFRSLFEVADAVTVRVDDVLGLQRDALLVRWTTTGVDRATGGVYEKQFLLLLAFGPDGLVTRSEQFDADREDEALTRFDALPGNLDAAYVELDERYAAEATDSRRAALTRAFTQAFAARDWDALATLLAPDLVVKDHRQLGWEPLYGSAAYVQALQQLVDLAPDVQLRVDHVTMADPRFLYETTWVGTRDGGAFEAPSAIVCELDAQGRIRRFDQYDIDELAVARAQCLAGDARPMGKAPARRGCDPLRIPPNAATRASDRWQVAFEGRDWDALEALYAPTLVFDERRRFSVGRGDRDTFVASDRWMASHGTRVARTVRATAGDRLALEHRRWTAAEDAAPFEVETLHVIEIDAEGRVAANVVFDADARRAASLEMFDRYFCGEGARWTPPSQIEFVRALNDHDLDRARAVLPDDFIFHDHRRTGLGRIGNVDDYIASLAALYEQSPNAATDTLYHVAVDQHGSLSVGRMFGTLVDGGEFESVFVRLNRYQDGRGIGAELFEIEDLDIARARFEELRPDPLRIPLNAASRVRERVNDAFMAKDWAAQRSLASDDLVFEDRRKRSMIKGGVDLWIKSAALIQTASGVAFDDELIGSLGDRVELRRRVVTGTGPDGDAFESEFIVLTEVDAHGRLAASINFDPEDRHAAFDEAQARFLADEAASSRAQAPIVAFSAASARRDWEGMRRCLSEDAVVRDRSTLGLGAIRGDEFIDALRAQADLAPDVGGEVRRILTWNDHGRVDVVRVFGTIPGGGAFEKAYVRVFLTGGDRIQHFECYDLGQADKAVARFEELCANVAVRSRS